MAAAVAMIILYVIFLYTVQYTAVWPFNLPIHNGPLYYTMLCSSNSIYLRTSASRVFGMCKNIL